MVIDRKKQELIVFGLVALTVVLAALASALFYQRLDLTSDKAFSISKVSRGLFKEIDEQLRVTYYVSDRLKRERAEPKRIEDLLREYASYSRGKIKVRVVDPDVTGDSAAIAQYGVQSQQYQTYERNEASVATVYSGIVIQYKDQVQTLPVVFSVNTLEYDLTRAIRKAVSGKDQVALILNGDSGKDWERDYKEFSEELAKNGWVCRQAKAGEAVPDDVNVVLVVGNSNLDDFDLYPVDQYLMRGGNVFFAVKGVDVNTQYGLSAAPIENDAALKLLEAYGVNIAKELVLDDACLNVPFQMQSPTGGSMIRLVHYPHWVTLLSENVNPQNPLGSRVAGLDLFWPSPISLRDVPGLKAEAIVKSSQESWRSTKDFAVAPQDEFRYTEEKDTTGGQYLVAVSLSGKFPSAFAGKDAPSREGMDVKWAAPVSASAEGKAVVVSSVDFLTGLVQYSKSQGNIGFGLSVVDWLGSDADLGAIRTRNLRDARLNKIRNPASYFLLSVLTYLVVLVLLPLVVIGFGVVRYIRRKRREKRALSMLVERDKPKEVLE